MQSCVLSLGDRTLRSRDEYFLKSGVPPPPDGWRREVVPRKTVQGSDAYYYSPCGTRFRSKPEVQRFLDLVRPEGHYGGVSIDSFDFSTQETRIVRPVNEGAGKRRLSAGKARRASGGGGRGKAEGARGEGAGGGGKGRGRGAVMKEPADTATNGDEGDPFTEVPKGEPPVAATATAGGVDEEVPETAEERIVAIIEEADDPWAAAFAVI